jgi:hypothetical protein
VSLLEIRPSQLVYSISRMAKLIESLCFFRNIVQTQILIYITTPSYEHMYAYATLMSTSKILSRLDLEIYEVSHQKCLTIDGDFVYH